MAEYKLVKRAIASAAMLFLLSSCAPRSDCEIPDKHAHKYVEYTDLGKVERWEFSDSMKYGNSDWTPEIIKITEDDKNVFQKADNYFRGDHNWDYLYNYMRTHKDYLIFYYEYYTDETTVDSNGKEKTERVRHDGWHNIAYDSDNTGDVKVVHTRYYGNKIAIKRREDGSLNIWLEQSPVVDDIRDIVREYPYFSFSPGVEVESHSFYRSPWTLTSLRPEDFSYMFNQPDLSKRELEPEKEGPKLTLERHFNHN